MALPFSQFSLSPCPKSAYPNITFHTVSKPRTTFSKHPLTFPQIAFKPRKFTNIPKASEKENPTPEEEDLATKIQQSDEMTELGTEIKKAMKERGEKEPGFVSGVVEEIKEIEWPAFNKVLGITGVVLGVIAGSSVVLLTVNAVLAEISDRAFAGRGVQDFFG
ncbi:hypothetical protein ACS0TY_022744 [Phlomoides rotata]